MKNNKLSRVAISLLMFSILFITCENSKKKINGVNNAKSDTTIYAGTGEFLAHPYGVDTFFLDTIKSIKIGVDSILFITSQMEFDFKDATNASHIQDYEYHFFINDSAVYQRVISGEKFTYKARFHILKGDSIHFFTEEIFGNNSFTTGILAKRISKTN